MNTNFVLMDKVNNLQKNATAVVKFVFENKDYMIYSIPENEENCQVLASKIILNSEGKNFIEDITSEEKTKISNLVYNMVILIPTEAKKGTDKIELIKNLKDKYSVNLSLEIPELMNNDYFNNSSIAITNKTLINDAIDFYKDALKENIVENNTILTWTLPVQENTNTTVENASVTSEPTENVINSVEEPKEITSNQSINTVVMPANIEIPTTPVVEESKPVTNEATVLEINNVSPESMPVADTSNINSIEPSVPSNNNIAPPANNPQMEKLAIVSDPSINEAMGIKETNMQPNVMKRKAGFAINKYIVIGTVCILVSIAVVIIAYILIQKKTTGV